MILISRAFNADLICKDKAIIVQRDDKDIDYEETKDIFVYCIDGNVFSNYVNYFIRNGGCNEEGYSFPVLAFDNESWFEELPKYLSYDDLVSSELKYRMTIPNSQDVFFDKIDIELLYQAFQLFKKYELFSIFSNFQELYDNKNGKKEVERLQKNFGKFILNNENRLLYN